MVVLIHYNDNDIVDFTHIIFCIFVLFGVLLYILLLV